jgi:hypothetical protein
MGPVIASVSLGAERLFKAPAKRRLRRIFGAVAPWQPADHGRGHAEELQARGSEGTGRDSAPHQPDLPAHRAQIGWLVSSPELRTRRYEPELSHNTVACAPSRMVPPNRPWFWIASLIRRKASTPPALTYDVRCAVGRPASDGFETRRRRTPVQKRPLWTATSRLEWTFSRRDLRGTNRRSQCQSTILSPNGNDAPNPTGAWTTPLARWRLSRNTQKQRS